MRNKFLQSLLTRVALFGVSLGLFSLAAPGIQLASAQEPEPPSEVQPSTPAQEPQPTAPKPEEPAPSEPAPQEPAPAPQEPETKPEENPPKAEEMPAKEEADPADDAKPNESAPQFEDEQVAPSQDKNLPQGLERTSDGKLRFNFEGAQWEPVINWFADECGFSLQPTDDYPEGSFTYHDDEEYTILEALDQLNHALSLRGYTLVRNRKMLVLRSNRESPPDELIEDVTPEQLKERGKYEIMRCVFDLSDLEGSEIDREVERIVSNRNRDSVIYVPSAKKLFVRDVGERLRVVNQMLGEARRLRIEANTEVGTYEMKNVVFVELMGVVRPMLGNMAEREGNYAMEDGSLTVVQAPGTRLLYLKGTPKRIEEFKKVAAIVDVPVQNDPNQSFEKPYLKTYPVPNDPTLVFQILNTVLEGREVKLDQDQATGAVVLLGRKEDHDMATMTIDEVVGQANNFARFELKNRTGDEVVEMLQKLFRQDPEEQATSGPIFIVDDISDNLIVKASPQEITFIKRVIEEFDLPTGTTSSGVRSNTRLIPSTDVESERILSEFETLWPTVGRKNRINVVSPSERGATSSSRRRGLPTYPPAEQDEKLESDRLPNEPPSKEKSDDQATPPRSPRTNGDGQSSSLNRNNNVPVFFVSAPAIPQDTDTKKSDSKSDTKSDTKKSSDSQESDSDDKSKATGRSPDYIPPTQQPTVPNAPVSIQMTPSGLVITSDDLDALDDAEQLIRELLTESSEPQVPQVFQLKYRRADEVKGLLETVLGISSGGGGGGGGMGGIPGMIGNMAGNMIGGAGGDLLSGLLGGGDSGSGASTTLELEGTVTFVEDIRLNVLYVMGATEYDLDLISELVDFIDQPEAPHAPDFVGPTWLIKVKYRDPEELKGVIEKQYSAILTGTGGGGGGDPGAQQAQQQAQMMQQMQRAMQQALGGGRGRGGGQDAEEMKPKAVLGVDKEKSYILVTGPKFIYEQINNLVMELDVKESPDDAKDRKMIAGDGTMNPRDLAEMLKAMYPDKIEIVQPEQTTSTGATPGSRPGGQPGAGGQGGGQPAANPFADMLQQIQQRQQQGRGGAGGGAGGGRGGMGGGGRGGMGGGGGRGGGGGGMGGGGGGAPMTIPFGGGGGGGGRGGGGGPGGIF